MADAAPALLRWTRESEHASNEEARVDPADFGRLYERYRDNVYRYLLSRTQTTEEAEDLLQQTFLRAMDALPQYRRKKGPFVAWILGIARNLSVDAHRRRRANLQLDLVPEIFRAGEGSSVEAEVLQREDLSRLGVLFRGLPADKRELLILRFAAGLTVRDIAAVIGKSEDATKKQFSRLLKTLKDQYYDAIQ